MGFKTDREFLRNITMGAVGTRQAARLLNEGGFRIIELERYSQSNKLWATKIKRFRVPDLLCLHSGTRIECRAKGTLKVTMSHALNNPDRAWDKGLRDDDLVAFIKCYEEPGRWRPANTLCLFRVADMRATEDAAGLSQMKSAAEGSEIQLTWPSTIPSQPGHVEAVEPDKIRTVLASGRRQSYRLISKKGGVEYSLTPYVQKGDVFEGEEQIIASVMPQPVKVSAPDSDQYDFISDLGNDERETVYVAAKALGYLPELVSASEAPLNGILNEDEDPLLRLEAAAALARLGFHEGSQGITAAADAANPGDVRMEVALILGELSGDRPFEMLKQLATDTSNPSELRAAAAWGMAEQSCDLLQTPLTDLIADDDEDVAVHALVAASRLITDDNLSALIAQVGDDARKSAGIARAVVSSSCNPVPIIVQAVDHAEASTRSWLIYLLASLGKAKSEAYVRDNASHLLPELDFFWKYHEENWTNRLDLADQLDFLGAQYLE